jgi:hypothetical protein
MYSHENVLWNAIAAGEISLELYENGTMTYGNLQGVGAQMVTSTLPFSLQTS